MKRLLALLAILRLAPWPTVATRLRGGNPATIIWIVIAVEINAVYVQTLWALSHVSQEIFKAVFPTRANFDPMAPIVFVIDVVCRSYLSFLTTPTMTKAKFDFHKIIILSSLGMCLLLPCEAFPQGGQGGSANYSTLVGQSGQPLSGVNIAVCGTLTTSAAAVAGNIATLTVSSTTGFVSGMTLNVAGFTAGDTYFNGTFTIVGLSPTTLSYSLTHANASAGTNGKVYQTGNSANSCAPLSSIYSEVTLTTVQANPFTSDGIGNWSYWAAPGNYEVQFYGSNIQTTLYLVQIPAQLTGTNTWSAPQTFSAGATFNAGITTTGPIVLKGGSSGTLSISAPTAAGSSTIQLGVTGNGAGAATFPAATDTVMELTQTQSPSNKSFTAASSLNSVTLSPDCPLQGVKAPIVGNSSDQVYYTCTLSASAFAASKGIRVHAVSKHTTGTASIGYRLSFGGTFTTNTGACAGASTECSVVFEIFNNVGATNAQSILGETFDGATGVVTPRFDTASIATTGTVVISVTFNVANTDQITPHMFWVELIQ